MPPRFCGHPSPAPPICDPTRLLNSDTCKNCLNIVEQRCHRTTFYDWTNGREVTSLGTNAGAQPLPFQDWRRIKEAFAPELISRALEASPTAVQRCIDPFGGSGTTGSLANFWVFIR